MINPFGKKGQEVEPFRPHFYNAWVAFTRKRAVGFLHGKAVSQTYRQPSARLRFAWASISSHCCRIAIFDNLVNLALKRFRRSLIHSFCYILATATSRSGSTSSAGVPTLEPAGLCFTPLDNTCIRNRFGIIPTAPWP